MVSIKDIDGTLVVHGTGIFDISDHLAKKGLMHPEAVEKAHQIRRYKNAGLIPYESYSKGVLDNMAAALEGKEIYSVLAEASKFLGKNGSFIFPYSKPLIRALRDTHDVFLVTANLDFYANWFVKYFSAAGYFATELGTEGALYTGTIKRYLAHRTEKQVIARQLLTRYPYEGSFGFGDASGDISILYEVQYPICVNPDGELKNLAIKNGWKIATEQQLNVAVKAALDMQKCHSPFWQRFVEATENL